MAPTLDWRPTPPSQRLRTGRIPTIMGSLDPGALQMIRSSLVSRLLVAAALALAFGAASAQSLPVNVTASGNQATVVIGSPSAPLADVTLNFEDASNLSASSLGVSAELVSLTDPALLARLPDVSLIQLNGTFPLLLTIEPPALGGLRFRDSGRIEIHTHALTYSLGSSFRLFKAPVGGPFRDITDEIAQGSVRARGTYGGFSQFLVVADVRSTSSVIATKITALRGLIAALPLSERGAFTAQLDQAESAIAAADYASALSSIDTIRARAESRGGMFFANEWRATRDADNLAGELIAGAATLRFSVAYLRDFGQ